ncbi:MAG: CPBP family intramembrane metalloprotease, partial [Deltaproteobacteria bacterium]|nr:CPBP family intramembrane metalloprotease [Deltaproteobacteria bacterium]
MSWIGLYIVLTLTLSWSLLAWIFSGTERLGHCDWVMFIPATVAIILNFVRRRPLKEMLRPVLAPVPITTLVFSILYPLGFIGLIALATWATGLSTWHPAGAVDYPLAPPLTSLALSLPLVFGEEYGWRGWLLENLSRDKGRLAGTIGTGLIWAIWHGPVIYGLAKVNGLPGPWLLTTIQMTAIFIFSFAFAWLYFRSGSIIPPMIMHYLFNYYNPMILGDIYNYRHGWLDGNLLLINGETVAGILFGLPLMAWFIIKVV